MKFHSERLTGSDLFARFFHALPHGGPNHEAETARFLGITVQTFRRYVSGKAQPPAPLVSLLWHESTYGRAVLDEHAHRGMLYARAIADDAKAETARARARIIELEEELAHVRAAVASSRPRLVAMNEARYQVA